MNLIRTKSDELQECCLLVAAYLTSCQKRMIMISFTPKQDSSDLQQKYHQPQDRTNNGQHLSYSSSKFHMNYPSHWLCNLRSRNIRVISYVRRRKMMENADLHCLLLPFYWKATWNLLLRLPTCTNSISKCTPYCGRSQLAKQLAAPRV